MIITNTAMSQAKKFKNDVDFGDQSINEIIKIITNECLKLNISLKEISAICTYSLCL